MKTLTYAQRLARTAAYLAHANNPDNFDPTGAFIAARTLNESDRAAFVKQFTKTFKACVKAHAL